MRFEDVKYLYDTKTYDIEDLRRAVIKGWITRDDFKKITNKDY